MRKHKSLRWSWNILEVSSDHEMVSSKWKGYHFWIIFEIETWEVFSGNRQTLTYVVYLQSIIYIYVFRLVAVLYTSTLPLLFEFPKTDLSIDGHMAFPVFQFDCGIEWCHQVAGLLESSVDAFSFQSTKRLTHDDTLLLMDGGSGMEPQNLNSICSFCATTENAQRHVIYDDKHKQNKHQYGHHDNDKDEDAHQYKVIKQIINDYDNNPNPKRPQSQKWRNPPSQPPPFNDPTVSSTSFSFSSSCARGSAVIRSTCGGMQLQRWSFEPILLQNKSGSKFVGWKDCSWEIQKLLKKVNLRQIMYNVYVLP